MSFLLGVVPQALCWFYKNLRSHRAKQQQATTRRATMMQNEL
jgi:hypothetical protein